MTAPAEAPVWDQLPPPDWEHLFYPPRGYQYFRVSQPFESGANLSAVTTAWMADAAMLAYARSGPDPLSLDDVRAFLAKARLKCEPIGNWHGHGTQGYFASNENFAVLAFRGTEKGDFVDLLTDAFILPVPPNEQALRPGKLGMWFARWFSGNAGVRVHAGFQWALNTVWPQVRELLETYAARYPHNPIFFTGHSLGAALATIAITRVNVANAALYTIGSPRVGSPAFCDLVRAKATLGIYRVANHADVNPTRDGNQDLVTMVPPKDRNYCHTAGGLEIGPDGNVGESGADTGAPKLKAIQAAIEVLAQAAASAAQQKNPPDELVDHSPGRYCYYLWRAAARKEFAAGV